MGKQGETPIPGLTDREVPRRLGPKRASKIRKLFNLAKEDDVRKYVIRRDIPGKDGKKGTQKAPKIQRLITPLTIQRKRHRLALKVRWQAKSRAEKAEYEARLQQAAKERRMERLSSKRRASAKSSFLYLSESREKLLLFFIKII